MMLSIGKAVKSNSLLFVVAVLPGLSSADAALTPGARYFSGQVKVALSQPSPCHVELLYSSNLMQVQARSISTLQHLSTSGQLIWIGVGPYTANYLPQRSLYRYQDSTAGALVKDLVVNTSNQVTPVKHGILFWHAQAGHHDPVLCEGLVEKTSPQDLLEMDQVFQRFDELKP